MKDIGCGQAASLSYIKRMEETQTQKIKTKLDRGKKETTLEGKLFLLLYY